MALSEKSEEKIATDLMALIYDAALDPSHWQKFVEALPKAMPGLNPVLYMADTQTTLIDMLMMTETHYGSFIPEYLAHYNKLNPWTEGLATRAPVGVVLDTEQFITTNDLKNTEFYTDFLSNYDGFEQVSGTVLNRTNDSFAVLGLHSSVPMYEKYGQKIYRIQQLIIPHMSRAFEISRKLGHGVMLEKSLESTLEAMTSAALVIGEQLDVYYANTAARALFEDGSLTLDASRSLCVGSGLDETDSLRKALTLALGPSPGFAENQVLKITCKNSFSPLIAQVMPLSSPAGKTVMTAIGNEKQALLVISNPFSELKNMQTVLALAFGLTAREAHLAAALANGVSVADYARGAQIKVDTARSQLKTVFSKTNTHRQSELVALIIRMTHPLNASR